MGIDPDTAYPIRARRSRGLHGPASHCKRREPLDFLAVPDHIEGLGVANDLDNREGRLSRSAVGRIILRASTLQFGLTAGCQVHLNRATVSRKRVMKQRDDSADT